MQPVSYLIVLLIALMIIPQIRVLAASKRLKGRPTTALRQGETPLLADDGPGLVYFFSPACGACRPMTRIIDQLHARYPNVLKLDVNENPEIAAELGIRATPTTLVVKTGKVEQVFLGTKSQRSLEAALGGGKVRS